MPKKLKQETATTNVLKLQNRLAAKTEGHKEYVRAILENDYVLVKGPPGSSKSYTAAGMACEFLCRENSGIEKIILIRPMIQTGMKNLGILPGSMEDKYSCYLLPLYDHVKYFLGESNFRMLSATKKIESIPLEIAKGMNFENSFVIVDEAENCDYSQLSMILCRICSGSKIIINGDEKQTDLKQCDFASVFKKLKGLYGVATVELCNADIVRSGMIAKILQRLEN